MEVGGILKYCLVVKMSADTDRDSIANDTLQESFGDILNLLNIDDIVSPLHVLKRVPLSELERLQNFNSNLTDQQRKLRLYVTTLAGKGQQGLDAFLKALDETADQYEPHALLAKKLRAKFKLKIHYSSPGTPVVPNRPATSTSSNVILCVHTHMLAWPVSMHACMHAYRPGMRVGL